MSNICIEAIKQQIASITQSNVAIPNFVSESFQDFLKELLELREEFRMLNANFPATIRVMDKSQQIGLVCHNDDPKGWVDDLHKKLLDFQDRTKTFLAKVDKVHPTLLNTDLQEEKNQLHAIWDEAHIFEFCTHRCLNNISIMQESVFAILSSGVSLEILRKHCPKPN